MLPGSPEPPRFRGSLAIAALFQMSAGAVALGLVATVVMTECRVADLPLDPGAVAYVAVPLLAAFRRPLTATFARPDEAVVVVAAASTVLYGTAIHLVRRFRRVGDAPV